MERWVLQWDPETEIEVVEATLKGDRIETAAAFVLHEKLEAAKNIAEAAVLVKEAYICDLPGEIPNVLTRLQELFVDDNLFTDVAMTTWEISRVIAYKDNRNIDTSALVPIMQKLFLRGALVMFDGAVCDDEASKAFMGAIDKMHIFSQEYSEEVDDDIWLQKLWETALSDSRNAKISGVALAVLLERGKVQDDLLTQEISRRLSYGVPGDLGAQWFEGLSDRNRYALLSRATLWEQLDNYLDALDENEFKRCLVFLRRAFGNFEPREKNGVVEILAGLWHVDTARAGEFLLDAILQKSENQDDENEENKLTEDEQKALDDILSVNDFDFGDLM